MSQLIAESLHRSDNNFTYTLVKDRTLSPSSERPVYLGISRLYTGREFDDLALRGGHPDDFLVVVELERVDALEAFLEVGLDSHRVLGLG